MNQVFVFDSSPERAKGATDRFRSLVTPIDFGDVGDRALATVATLARRADVDVHLATTVSIGLDPMIDLSDLVLRAAAFGLANATTHVVETEGEALTDLATLLRSLPDPLLCIATHGHSALAELAFSSATEQLLLTDVAPALVVGPHADAGHLPAVLAVGVGPEGLALPLAHAVQSWQATFGGEVELVEVVHPELTPRPIPRELFVAASALGHPVRSIESNDPVQALLDLASERDVLLAVASDLPRGVRRMLHGSVAWELIRYSPGPVLVVHAPHHP